MWGQRGPGYLGFVSSPDVLVRTTSIYLTTNLKSSTEIDGLIEDYTGVPHIIFNGGGNRGDIENMEGQTAAYSHDSLMRYQGMTDDRSIWGTLYTLAFILSAVVIGIGLLVGLAGTFAVFAFAGEGIGMLIDQEAFANTGFSTIAINPAVLALSTLLAIITVFISATIPSRRARRRREMRKNRRTGARGASFGRIFDNLRLRTAGVPGLLAHRNLTRASAKGRVAVASLAVSVALIIISGGISHYLNYLTQVVDNGGSDIEVPHGSPRRVLRAHL